MPVSSNDDAEIIEKYLPEQVPFHALLPGMESQPSDCQEPAPHYCLDCETAFWVVRSCNERGCPVCFEKWAWIEAGRASRRIWTKRAHDRKKGIFTRCHHVVISIRYKGQSYEKLKDIARKTARKHGVDGEMMIYHQWRKNDNRWLNDGTIHFHLVALASGFLKFNIESDDDLGEWVIDGDDWKWQPDILFKVIPNKSTPDKPWGGIPKVHDLRRLIAYQLSHCSILETKHSVIWSGSIAYRKWSQAQVDEYGDAPVRGCCCPKCQSFNTEPCRPSWYQGDNDMHVGWIMSEGHPLPEEPPPPRRRVSLRLIVNENSDIDWLTSREASK